MSVSGRTWCGWRERDQIEYEAAVGAAHRSGLCHLSGPHWEWKVQLFTWKQNLWLLQQSVSPLPKLLNSSSQLIFRTLRHWGHYNICMLLLGTAVGEYPWVSSLAGHANPALHLKIWSARKGFACTEKPSVSCILGQKRVIWSPHVGPMWGQLIRLIAEVFQCSSLLVLSKMLLSASQPRWLP